MADPQGESQSIFRQSAMNRIASADDLDKYIRVTNPSAWVVLAASILLLGGLAIWAVTAIIPTTISVTGLVNGNEIICWVDKSTAVKIQKGGAFATIADTKITDLSVDTMPESKAEVKSRIGSDYIMESVSLTDWNYEVSFTSPPKPSEDIELVPVSITVSETNPLNLVLGNQ